MSKKTNSLHLRISSDLKRRLKEKAENLGLKLTNYIEKIANEPIIFMDDNVKRLIKNLEK